MGWLAFGLSYVQSVTPNLAMGGEGLFLAAQGAGIANYTLKYTMPAKGEDEIWVQTEH